MKLTLVRPTDKKPVRFKARGGYTLYARERLARDEAMGHHLTNRIGPDPLHRYCSSSLWRRQNRTSAVESYQSVFEWLNLVANGHSSIKRALLASNRYRQRSAGAAT